MREEEEGRKGQSFLLFISHRASNLPVKETNASDIHTVKYMSHKHRQFYVSRIRGGLLSWMAFFEYVTDIQH